MLGNRICIRISAVFEHFLASKSREQRKISDKINKNAFKRAILYA